MLSHNIMLENTIVNLVKELANTDNYKRSLHKKLDEVK